MIHMVVSSENNFAEKHLFYKMTCGHSVFYPRGTVTAEVPEDENTSYCKRFLKKSGGTERQFCLLKKWKVGQEKLRKESIYT